MVAVLEVDASSTSYPAVRLSVPGLTAGGRLGGGRAAQDHQRQEGRSPGAPTVKLQRNNKHASTFGLAISSQHVS